MSQTCSTWGCCPSYPNWASLGAAGCTSTCLSSYSHVSLTFQKQTPLFCSEYRKHFPGSHHLPFLSTGSKNGLPLTPFSFRRIQGFIKTFQDRQAELSLPLGPNLARLHLTGGSGDQLTTPLLPIKRDFGALGRAPGLCRFRYIGETGETLLGPQEGAGERSSMLQPSVEGERQGEGRAASAGSFHGSRSAASLEMVASH